MQPPKELKIKKDGCRERAKSGMNGGQKEKKITRGCSKRFPHFNGTNVIAYNDEIPVGFYLL